MDGFDVWVDEQDGSVLAKFNSSDGSSNPDVIQLVGLSVVGGPGDRIELGNQASFANTLNPAIAQRMHSIDSSYLTTSGLKINARLTASNDRKLVSIEYVIENPGTEPIRITGEKLALRIQTGRGLTNLEDPGSGYGGWLYAILDAFTADPDQAIRLDEDTDYSSENLATGQWFGWKNRYELSAIRIMNDHVNASLVYDKAAEPPISPAQLSLLLDFKTPALNQTPAPVQTLAPGTSLSFQLDAILAQKKRSTLTHPEIGLDNLVLMNLWDWFRWLCFGIWAILDLIFGVFGDWGITIIMLALVVRIFTIPVTRLSLKYQELALHQQTRMAPLIRAVKDSYSGLEQSEQLIQLYEDQNYDHLAPFKSMLGLFIQIPIFIALFNVLGEAYELRGAGFLWIGDLASSDRLFDLGVDLPYFGRYLNLLPFLMAAVTVLSTWLSARYSGTEKTQSVTLFGMAGLFFLLFYSFPSALVLYWMFSNFFQLLQQSLAHHLSNSQSNQTAA
jgi:YidC/Oxa1 family membrane protein insertase